MRWMAPNKYTTPRRYLRFFWGFCHTISGRVQTIKTEKANFDTSKNDKHMVWKQQRKPRNYKLNIFRNELENQEQREMYRHFALNRVLRHTKEWREGKSPGVNLLSLSGRSPWIRNM